MRSESIATVQISKFLISAAVAGNRESFKERVKGKASLLGQLCGKALPFAAQVEMASNSKGKPRKEDQIRLKEVKRTIPNVTQLGSGVMGI